MKIWALEKLQRMMTTMFDNDLDESAHGHNTRSRIEAVGPAKKNDSSLTSLLRNERLNGPLDRDPNVASKDMIVFKGPFIFVRDLTNVHRPVMVREYPKVANREDGTWPQFRSVSGGKCPFVEEPAYAKRERERVKAEEKQESKKTNMAPPKKSAFLQPGKRALGETDGNKGRHVYSAETIFENSKVIPQKRGSPEPESTENHMNYNAFSNNQKRMHEPIASGVQPSNITSAIRSQMISSTAAQPGAKAGTSRDVHELKRKVFGNNNPVPNRGIPESQRLIGLKEIADGNKVPQCITKTKISGTLGAVDEDMSDIDENEFCEGAEYQAWLKADEEIIQKKAPRKAKAKAKRDLKPGYCENCREKFEDFDAVSFPTIYTTSPNC
jgi:regulatory subunit for Cdc7p protein kinase